MRGLHLFVAMVVVLGAASVARAQTSEFDRVVRQGMAAYQAKDFNKAIRAFERAYAIRPEPEMVFNVARSHEKAQHVDEAITTYERFLVLEGTTAGLRARALKSLTSLRAEKAARLEARSSSPSPAAPRPRSNVSGARLSKTEPGPTRSRALEWSLFGGGLVVAATGAVFAGLALANNSDFDDEVGRGPAADADKLEDLQDDRARNALIADILVPVGLVTAAVGLSLLVINDDDSGMAVRLDPRFDGQQAGLNLSGSF